MNDNETLVCLKCGHDIEIVDGDIIDGTLEIESPMLDNMFICVSCRYFGATVKFLQWGLNSNKVGVDIIGALKSTVRVFGNIRQYTGDLKIMIERFSKVGTIEDLKRINETLSDITNLCSMGEENDKVAIGELLEFGK